MKNASDAKAGDHPFPANVAPQWFGMGVLGANFPLTSFPSIDAAGSEIWARLHECIDCGTHKRTPSYSSIKLIRVRVIDSWGCFPSKVSGRSVGIDLPSAAILHGRYRLP